MGWIDKAFNSPGALPGWLLASLLCNMGIIVTGAVVRLTGSGLGCPTWPKCTDDSLVPHGELGIHGVIEFGNRLLTFVLIVVALGALIGAFRASTDILLRIICGVILVGIGAQGLLGGLSVHMQLNPYIVGLHLLGSIALIVGCTWTVLRVRRVGDPVGSGLRIVHWVVFALTMVVIYLGTLVTGSGPHSGDKAAKRTGFDVAFVAKAHAASVWVLLITVIVALVVFRKAGQESSVRASAWLLLGLVGQGVIGYIQYFTHLPITLVIAHMAGTAIVTVLAANVAFVPIRRSAGLLP